MGGDTFRKGSAEGRQAQSLIQTLAGIAGQQQAIANEQNAVSRPIRAGTASIYNQFLNDQRIPSFLDLPQAPQVAGLNLPGLELNQNYMRRQLLNQGSRGGLLQQQLAQSAQQGGIQRANLQIQDILNQDSRAMARSELAQRLFGAASDFGTGGTALSLQGLAGANQGLVGGAGTLTGLSGQRIEQNMAKTGATKQGAGAAAGAAAALAMCWIAEALYGQRTVPVQLIRRYLVARAKVNRWAYVGVWLYRRYGQRIALLMPHSIALYRVARWYFNKLLSRAIVHEVRQWA